MTVPDPAGYTSSDTARWMHEPNKSVDRTEFARDRARVMHSAALRRLAVKTQVMEAGQDDFPRTRLTHSLECAQVGRELGASLGCDPDLVDVACLSHDLGHPPFGHNGESALNDLASDIGGFEGNAQTFRLLTRLEPKAIGDSDSPRAGQSLGLNLTRSALDAASKYPWLRKPGNPKFGVYSDDVDVYEWMREGIAENFGEGAVCFEAQVMDWADDVSYCVHDIEDAIHAGHIQVGILESPTGRSEIIEIARQWYGEQFDVDSLDAALLRLSALDVWPGSFDGTLHSMAQLKNLTSNLIGRFCLAAQTATRDQYGPARLTRYSANLIVPSEARYEVTALKALAARFVMNRTGADQVYSRQRDQINQLHAVLAASPEENLDPFYLAIYRESTTETSRARAVIDQISALTDVSLVQWYTRLCLRRNII